MAAPKNPNPGPAAKKRREQGDATAARRLGPTLNMIDVHARNYASLTLDCTACGWSEYQDSGGPALTTLIDHALRHLRSPTHTADTVGSLRATLAAAEAGSWEGWKKDEAQEG